MIEEAVEFPARSPERAYELERAARKWKVSVRSLQRYIANLDKHDGDANALANMKPSNAGTKRVIISRKFDAAYERAGLDPAELPGLAEWLDRTIEAAWRSPFQRAGWFRVRREVHTCMERECQKRGWELPKSAFYLSRRRIMEAEHFRIVDIQAHDRKRYDDMKPRIRRDNTKFAPMEQVVMDVKPIDCIVRRPDGSTAWPKMIGMMDTGTHRIFTHFLLLDPGEGVRQEHIIATFLNMVSDGEWGLPEQVYRDNGTEFYMFDKIRAALEIASRHGRRCIINAKPYSGASKPIESKFAHLDRQVFSQMGGYAGGNRINKKTQTVGKPPKPYDGTFEEFVAEAKLRIADFESWEIMSGPFAGKSPREHFADHVASGWRPITVNGMALDSSFCDFETRRIDRGAVKVGTWGRCHHPELASLNGRTLEIALPWRRDGYPLAKLPELGWVHLEPEMYHLPQMIDGAIDASRSQRNFNKATRRKGGALVDAAANINTRVAQLPTSAAPAPLMDVMLSTEAENFAGARIAADRAARDAPSEAERKAARLMHETEELERYLARKKS